MPDTGASVLSWVVPLVGGGLAGAILTQIVQALIRCWQRPVLIAEFGNDVAGAIVQEPMPVSADDSQSKFTRQWIRLKVSNKGRSTAKNARVLLVEISNTAVGLTDWKNEQEVIDCGWSHIDATNIEMPQGTWRFIDIFVLGPLEYNPSLVFTGKGAKNDHKNIGLLSLKLLVVAENCEPTSVTALLRYQGQPNGMAFENSAAARGVGMIDPRYARRIRRAILWSFALCMLSVSLPLASIMGSFRPQAEPLGQWFERSGAAMTVFAAYAQFKATDIATMISGGTFAESWEAYHKYKRLQAVVAGLSLLLVIVGTVVWGYGDLLFPLHRAE